MKLDVVATLGARLWQLQTRAEVGAQAAAGLLEAFEADGAILWFADANRHECDPEDIFLSGPLVQTAQADEIALAIRAGRLEQWIAARGAAIHNAADIDADDGRCGLLAVSWRQARRMPGYVDAFLVLLTEQLKAWSEREAIIATFRGSEATAVAPASAAPASPSLRIVARGGGMGPLLEQAPDIVMLHTLRGRIIDANVAACTLLGYQKRELTGTSLAALMTTGASRLPWLRPNFADAPRVRAEYLMRRKDGRTVRLYTSTRVVHASGEHVAVMFAREVGQPTARSVSERHDVRVLPPAQPASASMTQWIVQATADLVFAKDAQGRYVQGNPAFCQQVGRPLPEVVGRRDGDLLPPEVAAAISTVEARVLQDGVPASHEVSWPVGERVRPFVVRQSPWRDEQRRTIGTIAVATDLTGRREREEDREARVRDLTEAHERTSRMLADQQRVADRTAALLAIARTLGTGLDGERASAAALAAIDAHVPEVACAVGEYDAVRHVVRVTAYGQHADLLRLEGETFRGFDASFGDDLLRGRSSARLRLGPSDFAVDAAIQAHGARGLAAVPLLSAGRPRGVLLLAWPVHREPQMADVSLVETIAVHLAQALDNARLHGELKSSLASLRDAQDDLVRTERLRALGEMAAGVAHDFNNSLTTILGMTEWLLTSLPEDSDIRSDLSAIRTAAGHAAALINGLQSFGRSSAHAHAAEPVSLAELAATLPELARPRVQEREARDHVSFEIVVEASPVPLVAAVAEDIRELLRHLIHNAIDALPTGGRILVRTRQVRGGAQVQVVDHGVGMTEDVRRRVFEPFFTTRRHAAKGLGLSVCWGIAARHGGTLAVDSAPGEGATVTLTLPAIAGRAAAAPPARPAAAAPPIRDLRIVLVDDEPAVRESVTDMLGALGHEVVAVDGGAAAIEAVTARRFDMVITDLGMPGMDGYELARRCRQVCPSLPVVLLTGWAPDTADLPEGVVRIVTKPLTLRALREAIADVLPSSGLVDTGAAAERSIG